MWEMMASELVGLGAIRWDIQRKFVESAYLLDRYQSETLRGVANFAEIKGEVAGFALIGEYEDQPADASHVAHVHGIFIHPNHRTRGAARLLMTHSMLSCNRMGLTEFHAQVLIANKPVIALARVMGYQMHSVNIIHKGRV